MVRAMFPINRSAVASAAAALALLGGLAVGTSPIAAAGGGTVTATGGAGTAVDSDGTQGTFDDDGDQNAYLTNSTEAAPQYKAG